MKRMIMAVMASILVVSSLVSQSLPTRARHGMVVSQKKIASSVGLEVLKEGGNAVDAAVATAFALAVTLPRAGNIGGGGFLIYRPGDDGKPEAYDFRETAPARATPDMFMKNGKYDWNLHHAHGLAVGVPGTVAGLYLAWENNGSFPWKRLVEPAILLAREGITVTDDLERSLKQMITTWEDYPRSMAPFTKNGKYYRIGDILKQPDLAHTLERIAKVGPPGFYEGETARLIVEQIQRIGGIITLEDLKRYETKVREPVYGTYRDYDIISMPPPSSGGVTLVQILNILEGFDLAGNGFRSAKNIHLMAETMRRAYSMRAQYLGDPDFNPDMPIRRLLSKAYAKKLRKTIDFDLASVSSVDGFNDSSESWETTHFSIVDKERNAVSLTYTIERPMMMVQGAGFLLNSELGDFNAGPGHTDREGLIGTEPNLAEPGKRPLSSMTPTILAKDGKLFMVTGSPGGRTIINTVMQTIINAVDFGMNAQEVIDVGRIHHQWMPDYILYEKFGFSRDLLNALEQIGHQLQSKRSFGCAQVIIYNREEDFLEGGSDRRRQDGGVEAY
jgi:gamma-glutamyltranspeptidase / glutathione hydrolase